MNQEPSSLQQIDQQGGFAKPAQTKEKKIFAPRPEGFNLLEKYEQNRKPVKKKKVKNIMFVLDNLYRIPKLMKAAQAGLGSFYDALRYPLDIKQLKDMQGSSDYEICFSQANFRLITWSEKLFDHLDPNYKIKLKRILQKDRNTKQIVDKMINSVPELAFIPGQEISQYLEQTNIYQNNEILLGNNKQFAQLRNLVEQDNKQKENFIPVIDAIKGIFQEVEFNIYFPAMVKVTIGGIQSMDKINQTADISLRLQVKVNVPGFSDSPDYYKSIFEKISICFKAEDLSNQFNINVKFDQNYDSDSGIKTSFEVDPQKYFEKSYKWSQYKMNTVNIDYKFQSFEGFILVVDLKTVKVKLLGDDDRSPFELLDIKGIVEIDELNVSLSQIKELFFINDKVISDLIMEGDPKINMKFNLVVIYPRQNTDLTPTILFNNITSYENIQKDGYSLATSIMFLETSNSRSSKYQISKNPCHRRWVSKQITGYTEYYEALQQNYNLGVLPNQDELQDDKVLQGMKNFYDNIKNLTKSLQKGQKNISLQQEVIKQIQEAIDTMMNEQSKSHDKIIKKIQLLRNIQFQLLKYQQKKHEKFTQDLLMQLEMAQYSQITLLEHRKIFLTEKRSKGREEQLELNQISLYLKNIHQIIWRIPKLRQYQHDDYFNNSKVHYHFPIYRHPGLSLFLLFITTNILGILNMFIFFQDPVFAQRLASLATLLISFVGMIPVTQSVINSIKITLSEILIYLMMLTPLLCLSHTFYLKMTEAQANPLQSPFFWVCLFITLLNIFVPLVSFLIFKFKEQPDYTKVNATILKSFEQVILILPGSEMLSKMKYQNQGVDKKERKTFPNAIMMSIVKFLTQLYKQKKSNYQSKFESKKFKELTLKSVHKEFEERNRRKQDTPARHQRNIQKAQNKKRGHDQ